MNSLQDKKQPSDKVPDGFTETIIYNDYIYCIEERSADERLRPVATARDIADADLGKAADVPITLPAVSRQTRSIAVMILVSRFIVTSLMVVIPILDIGLVLVRYKILDRIMLSVWRRSDNVSAIERPMRLS